MTTAAVPAGTQRLARLAGALYLLVIIGGLLAEAVVRQRMIVHGDAIATAANVLAHEQLYRWGLVADLLPLLCNMVLALLFYEIFKSTDRRAAALAAVFNVAGSTIQGAALLFHLGPLLLLKGVATLDGLTASQLQSLAYLSLRFQAHGYTLALVFFGCSCATVGYLVLRSGLLPRFIGVLMLIAGLCYFFNSMAVFVAPGVSSVLFLLPCLAGEGSLTAWLLFGGLRPRAVGGSDVGAIVGA